MKAEEIRKKFGSENFGEYDRIIQEIEKIAHLCKNYIHHERLSTDTIKKLKKEGFTIEFENNCYTIGW